MSAVRWERVTELLEASPGLEDLRAHGLHLLAARHWRAAGRPVPPALMQEEIAASRRVAAAPRVLAEIRRACDGPVLLVKGPAVAARYPEPAARPFIDLDIVVPDPPAVQRALLSAGVRHVGDPADYPPDLHHLPPIHLPAHPLPIEVHGRLKWVDQLPAPSFDRLSAGAGTAALGVDGVLEPAPAQHALILTGHLWAHDPLARLLRVLDVAVMAEPVEVAAMDALARSWGMGRMWRATAAVADALFGARTSDPPPLRTWARGLRTAREPTVAELHASRLLSPFSAYPPPAAARAVGAALAAFAKPHDAEPWRRKVSRTARQLARPGMRRSEHVGDITAGPPRKHERPEDEKS